MSVRVVDNVPCPDCGWGSQYVGQIVGLGEYVFCCEASRSRHVALMAVSPEGVRYVAPVGVAS